MEWTNRHEQVYLALQKAGEQIGRRDHAAQCAAYKGAKKKFQYNPCPELRAIVDALGALGRGELTPDAAMGLLHTPDIDIARFGTRVLTK